MKNRITKFHLPFLIAVLSFLFCQTTSSQSIDWLTIRDFQSSTTGVTQINDGSNYLINSISSGRHYVAYCNEQGVELFKKEICFCLGMMSSGIYKRMISLHTSRLTNGHHYHFYENGLVLESNLNYDTVGQFNIFQNRADIHEIQQHGDQLLISATDTSSFVLALNATSLEITNLHRFNNDDLRSIGGDIGNDESLLSFYLDESILHLNHQDVDGNLIMEQEMFLQDTWVSDALIGNGGQYYISGYTNHNSPSTTLANGFLIALDSDGEFLWRRDFMADSTEHFYNFTFANHIVQLSDNSLAVAGSKGFSVIGPIAKFYMANVQSDGTLSWEMEEDIYAEGTEINNLYVDDSDNVVIVGTTGISDYSGPQRTFMMQVSDLVGNSNVKKKEFIYMNISPNPTTDFITFESKSSRDIEEIQILDMNGRLVRHVQNPQQQLNVSSLSPSIYSILFKGRDWVGNARFLKL